PEAINKGTDKAKKSMVRVPIIDGTIPHSVVGRYGAARVMLRPASRGTGVIAGGPVRAVLEAAGYENVLTKSLGSSSPHNVVRATMNGLSQLQSRQQYMARLGQTDAAAEA
ncbi:MAG: 30S ribosomal protein S5, partial [Deltaproteobacteria bacterium CG17_big_fil_post_rev_8_21_14_2_50_63_7]